MGKNRLTRSMLWTAFEQCIKTQAAM